MNLFELTRSLIDIPSVSGAEAAVGRFLLSHLASLGYAVEAQALAPERCNVLATTGAQPRVVFSTHLDTVPPHIAARETEEFIYGRGACDAKGIIAAQIMAAERLRAEGIEELGLLFTVDEEVASAGARLANNHPLAAGCSYLIDGEPTGNKLAAGSKGSLRVRLTARGREAHSAYPEAGESAIEKLLDALASLRAAAWPQDEFFGATTCNIGTLRGGTRTNVIPAEAQAELHFRLVTGSAQVKEMLERAVAGRVEVEYLSVSEPARMLAVAGFEQEVVRFTTDIPYLSNWGAPLLIGPGSILDAHTPQERVGKRELREAVDLYADLARTLLARGAQQAVSLTEGASL